MSEGITSVNIPDEAVDVFFRRLPTNCVDSYEPELGCALRAAAPYIIMQYQERIAELEKEVEAAHAVNDDGCKSAYHVGYEHGQTRAREEFALDRDTNATVTYTDFPPPD